MNPPPSDTTPAVFDILVQVLEQAVHFLHRARPLIHQLKNDALVLQILKSGQDIYSQLPESLSLALTVVVIFVSSLMVFKVGRSIVGLIVTLIQMAIIFLVAAVVWKLRYPIRAWLEQVLNQ